MRRTTLIMRKTLKIVGLYLLSKKNGYLIWIAVVLFYLLGLKSGLNTGLSAAFETFQDVRYIQSVIFLSFL